MADDFNPAATYTLAEAIAELKRIGPVYSAAARLVDDDHNPTSRLAELRAAVASARPYTGATRGGDWSTSSNRQLDERAQADWNTIAGA